MAGSAVGVRGLASAAGVVIAAAAVAWIGAGAYVRRTQAERIPPLTVSAGTPEPAVDAVREADATARRSPSAATIGALGMAYHAAQLPDAALAAFALAEAMSPDDPAWPYYRALVLEERNDAGTEAALERTLALAPSHGLAWYRLAERRFKAQRLDEAEAAYTRAADAYAVAPFQPPGVSARRTVPLFAYAQFGLARVMLERGDRTRARQRLESVVSSAGTFGPARALLRQLAGGEPATTARMPMAPFVPPADPALDAMVASSRHSDVLLKHASLAARGDDPAWREFLVGRALSFNPRDLNVLMETAAQLQASRRYEDALAYLRQHEQLAPGDHHGLVEQGRTLIDLGRLGEAEAVLRRATAVRDAAAEYNLGVALDRQDRWDEARQHYDAALAIDIFHVRAMNNLGVGLDRRGQTPAALALFERASRIDPDATDVRVNMGAAMLHANRFADAVDVLQGALAANGRDANGWNNLGIALARLGNLDQARTAFTRAVEVDPRHADARNNLAQVVAALAR